MKHFTFVALVALVATAALAQGPAYPYSVALNWTLSTSTSIASQTMYRAPFTSSCGTYAKLLPPLSATQTTYTDQNPPEGAYCYAVTATNTKGTESGFSNIDSNVQIPPPPPTGLGNTVAKVNGVEKVTLAYTQSKGPGIVWNTAYLGTQAGGPYRTMHWCTGGSTKSIAHLGVPSGTYFAVVTATGNRESGASNETKIVVP